MRETLVRHRKKSGLTQDDVAKSAGIGRSHYALIESGKRTPSLRVAIRIAEAVGCDVQEIFLPGTVASRTNDQAATQESA